MLENQKKKKKNGWFSLCFAGKGGGGEKCENGAGEGEGVCSIIERIFLTPQLFLSEKKR